MIVSVLEYLGKLEMGVFVLLSIIYDNEYYEGTIYYYQENLVFTISDELQEKIGCPIEEHPDYIDILKKTVKQLIPYSEIYNRLDEIKV